MSGFLDRWSKRKAQARRDDAPEPQEAAAAAFGSDPADSLAPDSPATDSPAPDIASSAPEAAQSGPDAATEARIAALPALEDITAGTDIRPFLQDFVPRALRNAAMRRAWLADPIISTHLDVARDYAWEFNAGPLPVGFSVGLEQDVVQRGLDALNPPKAPEPQAETAQDALPAPQALAAEPVPPQPAARHEEDIGIAEQGEDSAPAQEEASTAPDSSPRLTLRPKKHGGALPD